jgi:hypothetical protein
VDRELRDQERRAQVDSAARVAVLTHRLRAGSLTPSRLRLAAQLGCEEAIVAAQTGSEAPLPARDRMALVGVLTEAGAAGVVRAAMSLGQLLLTSEQWTEAQRSIRQSAEIALMSAAEWAVCPCESHSARAYIAADGPGCAAASIRRCSPRRAHAVAACSRAAYLPTYVEDGAEPERLIAQAGLGLTIDSLGVSRAREALVRDLCPWLLGDRDRLLDLIAQRLPEPSESHGSGVPEPG